MAETPAAPLMPFAAVVPTLYGQMLVNRNDINQTNSLFKTGLALDHSEIVLLAQLLRLCPPNPVFIDVGANFGTYSMAMSQVVGQKGKVHSFEPQRIIFNLFVGSVALNSFTNVYCHNLALGDREGAIEIPQYDYRKPLNFGSVEFTPEQHEPLTQIRQHDPDAVETVPLTTLDKFNFPRVDMMKIDAEGMEPAVIAGAVATIARCRPILYVEFLKTDGLALQNQLTALNYKVYRNGMNFLAIPNELSEKIKLDVKSPDANTP